MDTITRMGIEEVKQIAFVVAELRKISKKLHRLDEHNCNYGNTPANDKRTDKLKAEAEEYAQRLDFLAVEGQLQSTQLRCPACGVPTIEDRQQDITEEEKLCARCSISDEPIEEDEI